MADSKVLPFMAWRRQALFLSVLLSLVAIGALAVKGLALGLDFTGGSQVELHFAQPVSPGAVRAQLADAGFSGPVVAHFGSENDLLIRVREGGEDLAERVLAGIRSADGLSEPEVRRVDFVGPQIGDELRDQGGLALLVPEYDFLISSDNITIPAEELMPTIEEVKKARGE